MLINKIQEAIQQEEKEEHIKDSFWATDSEKDVFELYHGFKNTKPTNPIELQTLMTFDAGNKMEATIIEFLEKAGMIKSTQERVEMEREGVKITGYIDAILEGGIPLEVKSYYGDYQTIELEKGRPKTNYCKQLAIYMDFLNVDKGLLLYRDRGLGTMYEFYIKKENDKYVVYYNKEVFENGMRLFKEEKTGIEFSLEPIFKRWKRLYEQNILKDIEPTPEFRYKYLIEDIPKLFKEGKITKSKITDARNGRAVLGDWQVKYSKYKDLYIKKEKTELGYTSDEIKQLKEITTGFTNWDKIEPSEQGLGIETTAQYNK